MSAASSTSNAVTVMNDFRDQLHKMEPQFKLSLPAHIPAERFSRAVMTAVQRNPKLLNCDWRSVFNACMKACQDGLLPDGTEGAIVPFGEEDDGGGGKRTRNDMAQWLPMIQGIRKKIRNSGEIREMHAAAVYKGDKFQYKLGAEPDLMHEPGDHGRNNKDITHVYSVARFNDGSLSFDVMSIQEVEDIRKRSSRAKKGPWSEPVFYQEMAIKTVVKHHAKSLPMSTDLDRVLHRDDALYDFTGAADRREPVRQANPPKSIAAVFDQFAADEPIEQDGAADNPGPEPGRASDAPGAPAAQAERTETAHETAHAQVKAETAKHPTNVAEYKAAARTRIDNADDGATVRTWLASDQQRKLRNSCGLVSEDLDEIKGWIEAKFKPAS